MMFKYLLMKNKANTVKQPQKKWLNYSKNASSVIITPGYGMAVAQAQYPVAEITAKLRERGINVRLVFTLLQVVYRVI